MSWRGIFQHNFWLKLFSLLLATLAWLTIRSQLDHGVTLPLIPFNQPEQGTWYSLPITVITAAADSRVFRVTPCEARVTLSGPPDILRDLDPKQIQVFVNLTEIQDATDLTEKIEVGLPHEVTLIRVVPAVVHVERVLDSSLTNRPLSPLKP